MIEPVKSLAGPLHQNLQVAGLNREQSGAASFVGQLADVIKAGENAVAAGLRGEIPMQQVVETVMQTERTLTAAISVRDKVVSAYLEMTRMQI